MNYIESQFEEDHVHGPDCDHDHEHVHGPDCNHDHHKQMPIRNEKKVGRNEPCPCGSGKKYKKCCLS